MVHLLLRHDLRTLTKPFPLPSFLLHFARSSFIHLLAHKIEPILRAVPMANHNPSKRSWTTREVAFIIGYADHCIHYGLDYADTVTHELFRVSSRDVTWNTVRGRVERVFRGFGVQDPSIQQFMNQGTAYLDLAAIPSDVFQELNQLRKEWGFARWSADPPSPRRSNDALGDTFLDDETVS